MEEEWGCLWCGKRFWLPAGWEMVTCSCGGPRDGRYMFMMLVGCREVGVPGVKRASEGLPLTWW